MRRNTKTKATLALAGLSGLLLGTTMDCSVPLCDERPGDPRRKDPAAIAALASICKNHHAP